MRAHLTLVTLLALVVGLGPSGCNGEPVGPQPCESTPSDRCWRFIGLDRLWVTALAVVDGQILAGTQFDGVFRNTGRAWTRLGLDHAVISDIVPLAGRNKLLVGVQAYSDEQTTAAVYASTNGGRTWTPADGGLAQRQGNRAWAVALASDPANPDRVYWRSNFQILRSSDAGQTWDFVYGSDSSRRYAFLPAIAVSPHGDGRVLVGGESALFTPLIFVSRDAGQAWTIVHPMRNTESIIWRLLFDAVTTRAYAGVDGGVMVSDDDGATWRFTLPLPGYVSGLALLGGDLYAASLENLRPGVGATDPPLTELGLYRSSDHGQTWTRLTTPGGASGAHVMIADAAAGRLLIGTRAGVWQVEIPTAPSWGNP